MMISPLLFKPHTIGAVCGCEINADESDTRAEISDETKAGVSRHGTHLRTVVVTATAGAAEGVHP